MQSNTHITQMVKVSLLGVICMFAACCFLPAKAQILPHKGYTYGCDTASNLVQNHSFEIFARGTETMFDTLCYTFGPFMSIDDTASTYYHGGMPYWFCVLIGSGHCTNSEGYLISPKGCFISNGYYGFIETILAHSGNRYVGFENILRTNLFSGNRYYFTPVGGGANYLKDTLTEGVRYCADFFSCRLHGSGFTSTGGIGLYVSKELPSLEKPTYESGELFHYEFAEKYKPVVKPPQHGYLDTVWQNVSGSFVAQGGEKYLFMGNAYRLDSIQIDTLPFYFENPHPYHHYMVGVDDVYLYPCSCQHHFGVDTLRLCYGEPLRSHYKTSRHRWQDGGTKTAKKVTQSGLHILTAYLDEYEYTRTDSVYVVVSGGKLSVLDTALCEGQSVTLRVLGENNTPLRWNTGDTGNSIEVSKTGKYYLLMDSSIQCTSTDTAKVHLLNKQRLQLSFSDTLLCKGERVELKVLGSQNTSYHWNTGEYAPSVFLRNTGKYYVFTEDLPCSLSDTARVQIQECRDSTLQKPLLVPDAFVPEQATNNFFVVIRTQTITEFEIQIFNRFGQIIFESNSVDFKWNGNDVQNRPCVRGAYGYRICYKIPSKPENMYIKGYVNLVR